MGEAWKDRFLGEFQCAQCGALYEVAITRLSAPVYDEVTDRRPDRGGELLPARRALFPVNGGECELRTATKPGPVNFGDQPARMRLPHR